MKTVWIVFTNIFTLTVSINGIFDKRNFGSFLFSEPNDDVPLSFDPSDSVTKLNIIYGQVNYMLKYTPFFDLSSLGPFISYINISSSLSSLSDSSSGLITLSISSIIIHFININKYN